MSDFQVAVEKERDRLTKQREDALARRAKIDDEIKAIDRELAAISAYETTKSRGSAKSKAVIRAARGTVQISVLEVIKRVPQGISRGDIIATMSAHGNKPSEQSISNALSALKKASKIASQDGQYVVT